MQNKIKYTTSPFMREVAKGKGPQVEEVIIKKGCSLGYSTTITRDEFIGILIKTHTKTWAASASEA